MWDVAFSDGTWVAVGVAQGSEAVDVGRADAAVWTSADAAVWTRVVDESALGGAGSQLMLAVTASDGGFVAVGAAERAHQDDPAVWLSEDGESWERVADANGELETNTSAQLWDVVVGGPGLVAVGFVGAVDTFDAGVWVSDDGTSWERIVDDVLAGDGNEFMTSAAVLGDGRIIVVGSEAHNGPPSPAVWVSEDGVSWQRSAGSVDGDGGAMFDVAVWDGGLVAVGRDESGDDIDAAVWVSDDGVDWRRVDDSSLGGPGDQALAGVTSIEGTVIAVGYDRIADRNPAVWVSGDGETWMRSGEDEFSIEGFQELFSVASTDDVVVAVGYSGTIGEWNAEVWRLPR